MYLEDRIAQLEQRLSRLEKKVVPVKPDEPFETVLKREGYEYTPLRSLKHYDEIVKADKNGDL